MLTNIDLKENKIILHGINTREVELEYNNLLDLINKLQDCNKILKMNINADRKDRTTQRIYERNWRRNKVIKMTVEEAKAYGITYVTTFKDGSHMYISRVNEYPAILQIIISGHIAYSTNIFCVDPSDMENLIDEILNLLYEMNI